MALQPQIAQAAILEGRGGRQDQRFDAKIGARSVGPQVPVASDKRFDRHFETVGGIERERDGAVVAIGRSLAVPQVQAERGAALGRERSHGKKQPCGGRERGAILGKGLGRFAQRVCGQPVALAVVADDDDVIGRGFRTGRIGDRRRL